jgi:hypothetical protein
LAEIRWGPARFSAGRQWQVKDVAKYDAREIQRLFGQGRNITSWIKAQEKADNVSPTAILYSYDAQAADGSAVDFSVGLYFQCSRAS